MKRSDSFYIQQDEPQQACLLALRDLILAQDSLLTETVKYGMPCFCYKKKIVCYLWVDKKTLEPYLLMADGYLLDDPELEKGSRSRMKIFRVNPTEDIPVNTIARIINSALDLYRS